MSSSGRDKQPARAQLTLQKMDEIAKTLVGKPAPPMPTVLPDLISIDGHRFPINRDGVPKDITDKLEEVFDEGGTYEQIPAEVLEYELKGDQCLCDEEEEEEEEEEGVGAVVGM
ncbi:hypothetical protein BO94DRAFT_576552 [Aspergillus sclerotioniger CBS 115572]|uniref:Uncharacterized protein n=1 Tax=Aspergillus sclerotioniger CBS 115572 TaxID=1450535 RepID=A0A317W998_9EURO|nr:hypothetical protein BO94DRAFT_576552 [Aspergillus sclerotioniger CBS 115572]PWY81578.1 hypothetical protein BO94DRAFT_576552 [Aspergillus sclerotioniger CBS 115572]